MKRLILFISLTLLGCSANEKIVVNKEQLIGQWLCRIDYPTLAVRTVDASTFHQNGKINSLGIVQHIFSESEMLMYRTIDEGVWQLNGNELTIEYDPSKNVVVRIFPKQVPKQWVKYEKEFYNTLNLAEHNKQHQGTLTISSFDGKNMSIQQNAGNSIDYGKCFSVESAGFIELTED